GTGEGFGVVGDRLGRRGGRGLRRVATLRRTVGLARGISVAGGQGEAGAGEDEQAKGHGGAPVHVPTRWEGCTLPPRTNLPRGGAGCCPPSTPDARTAASRSSCSSTVRPAISSTSRIARCDVVRSWSRSRWMRAAHPRLPYARKTRLERDSAVKVVLCSVAGDIAAPRDYPGCALVFRLRRKCMTAIPLRASRNRGERG